MNVGFPESVAGRIIDATTVRSPGRTFEGTVVQSPGPARREDAAVTHGRTLSSLLASREREKASASVSPTKPSASPAKTVRIAEHDEFEDAYEGIDDAAIFSIGSAVVNVSQELLRGIIRENRDPRLEGGFGDNSVSSRVVSPRGGPSNAARLDVKGADFEELKEPEGGWYFMPEFHQATTPSRSKGKGKGVDRK